MFVLGLWTCRDTSNITLPSPIEPTILDTYTHIYLYFSPFSYMGAYTMDVIASVAFGIDVDSQTDRNNAFVKHAKKSFNLDISREPMFMLLSKWQ